MTLHEGSAAPEFTLPDQDGVLRSLTDYKGKWVLLYFYPKDDTPGCTKEACAIRDDFPNFGDINAEVLGVSNDSPASHKKFANKYQLPFTLLADEESVVVDAYDVVGIKKMMGREFVGIFRTSFLIDPTGTIAKIYEKVKPELHAKEVLADIHTLTAK